MVLSAEDWQDILADCQAAFIGLGREEGSEYAPHAASIENGFAYLQTLRP